MHQVCAPLDRSSAACLRNHNEELRCIESLGGLALDRALYKEEVWQHGCACEVGVRGGVRGLTLRASVITENAVATS